MQIFADVTGREIAVAASTQAPALGAAMFGAVAAGAAAGGYDSIVDASRRMARLSGTSVRADRPRARRSTTSSTASTCASTISSGVAATTSMKSLTRIRDQRAGEERTRSGRRTSGTRELASHAS